MAITFKKVHGNADSKFIKKADGTQVLPDGTKQEKWTDTIKVLSPGLAISYRARPGYPTDGQLEAVLAAASSARTIMRKAVREMDRVVFFRRPEGKDFSNIMNCHFGLADDRNNGTLVSNIVDKSLSARDIGKKDRRWALNKVREGMLSISFHLNTGMYLIDCDNAARTVKSGAFKGAAGTVSKMTEEGYCTWASWAGLDSGLLSAWRNGEIHVGFKLLHDGGYSPEHYARVIIHEAAHKYLGVTDVKYAHEKTDYRRLAFHRCIDNADSFAWAALSLHAGHLIHGRHSKDSKARTDAIAPQAA